MRTLVSLGLLVTASAQGVITPIMRAGAAALLRRGDEVGRALWDDLAEVCDTFGPRFSGTKNLEDALDWISAKARADGLLVTEEPVLIPKWTRGREYITMLSPRVKDIEMVGLGMSIGTYTNGVPTPVEADVLVVGSLTELDERQAEVPGQIVLYDFNWTTYSAGTAIRRVAAERAARYGAVAAMMRSLGPFSLQAPHTGSSTPSTIPAAGISPEDSHQIRRIIGRGYTVRVRFYMEAILEAPVWSRNVLVEITGRTRPNEYVVIGGHIDSWDNGDGAMDDGGGTLASWHAIRMIRDMNLQPSRTIRAVLFTNEENGNGGGLNYAERHAAELPFTSMAIESDSGPFMPFRLGTSVNQATFNILRELGTLLEPINAGGVLANGGSGVDIGPMCETGVPCAALEVLDPRAAGQLGGRGSTNNPCLQFATEDDLARFGTISDGYFWFHHTTADTVDKIDPLQLQRTATSLAVWAYSISELPNLLPRGPPMKVDGPAFESACSN